MLREETDCAAIVTGGALMGTKEAYQIPKSQSQN